MWAALTLRPHKSSPAARRFTFGQLQGKELEILRSAGILSIGTACSVAEALALAENGVDAITVQGQQAGGHRGSWLEDARLSTLDLLRNVRAAVRLPLIAAGGPDDPRRRSVCIRRWR